MSQPSAILGAALLGASLLSTGCTAPPLAERTTEATSFSIEAHPEFTLGPEDRLRVIVVGHFDLSTPPDGALVDPDGYLALPLIGPVEVIGRTPEEVRLDVERRFAEYVRQPSVTLTVTEHGSQRVFVLGHVESPGEYALHGPRNAFQALSLSGGFLSGADRENIAILRPLRDGNIDVHIFNAATPGAGGLVQIHGGDLLFIRQSGAGTFAEQARPVITSLASAVTASSNIIGTLDRLGDGN